MYSRLIFCNIIETYLASESKNYESVYINSINLIDIIDICQNVPTH